MGGAGVPPVFLKLDKKDDNMFRPFAIAAGLLCTGLCFAQADQTKLTPAEKAAGWKVLFDGKDTAAWRAFKGKAFPEKGWEVKDGKLMTIPGVKDAPDIITSDEYGDFELSLEWAVGPKSNSGIIYRVAETLDTTWQTGPECQILDDTGNGMTPDDPHAAGALYDILGCVKEKKLRPVGEFNEARIRVRNGVVQHFLNGVKVVEYRNDTEEWKKRIEASKFKSYAGFGQQPKGHVALQYHDGAVSFRNIRIRALDAALPGEVKLFNGKDMSGWTGFFNDNGKLPDIFSVKDGVMMDKGNPIGYIKTEAEYKNYVIFVQWRFDAAKKPGNSGVLIRVSGADKVWPRSLEAQLQSGDAGDFWRIEGFPATGDAARTDGRRIKHTAGAERPLGEWNEYEIIVDHDRVRLNVNGETLNEATGVEEIAGKIALQSEGAEIEFKNIRLVPLP